MATVIKKELGLDLDKIKSRITKTVTSAEAVKDIVPIQWSNDVLSGKKKAIVKRCTDV